MRNHSRWLKLLLLLVALIVPGLLTGCQPATTSQPTAATGPTAVLGPALPPTATHVVAAPTAPKPANTAAVPPTAAAKAAVPVVAANPGPNALNVTILHTNDVAGEIDPCG